MSRTAKAVATPATPAAASSFGKPTFTKLDAAGSALPDDADDFAQVRVTLGDHSFDMLRGNVGDREMNFAAAQKACADLDALGHTDWRLPTDRELLAIVDRSKYSPAADPTFFGDIKPSWYWTGTPVASSPAAYAWFVSFHYGYAYYFHQNDTAFVRAVRSSSPASQ